MYSKVFRFFVLLMILNMPFSVQGEIRECFILWGGNSGTWDGSLTIDKGRFVEVVPYLFQVGHDAIESQDSIKAGESKVSERETITAKSVQKVTWRSVINPQRKNITQPVRNLRHRVAGLHITIEGDDKWTLQFNSVAAKRTFTLADFPEKQDKVIDVKGLEQYLVIGRGDPHRGPKLSSVFSMPDIFRAPEPSNPVHVGDRYWPDKEIGIVCTTQPPENLQVRRVSQGDGILYLQVFSTAGGFSGENLVRCGNDLVGRIKSEYSIWLALEPRFGMVEINIYVKDRSGNTSLQSTLESPTTLVEVRGRQLFVNGEVFLVKGTLPGGPTPIPAEMIRFLKYLNINTIRTTADRLPGNFMGLVPRTVGWPGRFVEYSKTQEEFLKVIEDKMLELSGKAVNVVKNPWTLIIQHANEQAFGDNTWSGRLGIRSFDRMDYLLASCYNVVKPLDPMLPHGYASNNVKYRLPDFMDVYMHNTYIKDKGIDPISTFIKFQCGDRRPFFNSEFGANVYLPQTYPGALNSPVLEKIHAWHYCRLWETFMEAGTVGGTNYKFLDSIKKPSDKGFAHYGIVTADDKPKLACWTLHKIWRDIDIEPLPMGNELKLRLIYKRDYWARNCRLTVHSGGKEQIIPLADMPPNSQQVVMVKNANAASFSWRVDYTTHRGLGMIAEGAYPLSLEEEDFLNRLKERKTYTFLRELFDAEVVSADGRNDNTALVDMTDKKGLVTVCFLKPNGTVYLTAFHRLPPGKNTQVESNNLYVEGVNIKTVFTGRAEYVEEYTGQATGRLVDTELADDGMTLKNIRVPYHTKRYSLRSRVPIDLPVIRIR